MLKARQRGSDLWLPDDENAPIELPRSFAQSMSALVGIERRMFSPVEIRRIVLILTLAFTLKDVQTVQQRERFHRFDVPCLFCCVLLFN